MSMLLGVVLLALFSAIPAAALVFVQGIYQQRRDAEEAEREAEEERFWNEVFEGETIA